MFHQGDLLPNLCAGAFLLLSLRLSLGVAPDVGVFLRQSRGRRHGASGRPKSTLAPVRQRTRCFGGLVEIYFSSENVSI